MRDAILFLIIFGSIPYILKRPALGAMMFAWVSLMNPHRLCYGAAYSFPFVMLIAGVSLMSILMSKEKKDMPHNSWIGLLIVFFLWTTITSFTALEQDAAWNEWNRVFKTFIAVLVTGMVLRSERDLKEFLLVIALSLGFYGLKGGVFTVLNGGNYRVSGPAGSYIEDNNSLALGLICTVPLLLYLAGQLPKRWMRLSAAGLTVFTILSIVGTYSRGALVGGACMLAFLWLKSPNKVRTGLAVALVAPLVITMMPQQWFGRMESIDNYQQDGSAMGRINAWHFAYNVATSHLQGGGYVVFSPRQFYTYAPDPKDFHAAHSIYFQVLGEHGFLGLAMFLALLLLAWRTGSRTKNMCKGKRELEWASKLANACQVSLIGYAASGAFLSLAYYDLPYYVMMVMVVLEHLIKKQVAEPPKTAALSGDSHPDSAPAPRGHLA